MIAAMLLTACGGQKAEDSTNEAVEVTEKINIEEATEIVLSDESITVAGEAISEADTDAVYKANDIIYYESGHDFTYGEGTEDEAVTPNAEDYDDTDEDMDDIEDLAIVTEEEMDE